MAHAGDKTEAFQCKTSIVTVALSSHSAAISNKPQARPPSSMQKSKKRKYEELMFELKIREIDEQC
jgi:hypothetical protein